MKIAFANINKYGERYFMWELWLPQGKGVGERGDEHSDALFKYGDWLCGGLVLVTVIGSVFLTAGTYILENVQDLSSRIRNMDLVWLAGSLFGNHVII